MACVTQCPPFFGHLVAQTTQIKQPQKKTTKKRSQKSPKKEQSTPYPSPFVHCVLTLFSLSFVPLLFFSCSQNFAGHADTNTTFARFLEKPTIRKADKKKDIEAICATGTFSPSTVAFLGTLAENGRLGEVSKINAKYAELMRASRGEVLSVVTSADALTKAQLKSLEASFKKTFLKADETLIMDTRVNPSILGGLQVQIGDEFMDLSLSSKVNRMHKMLSAEL
jgi:F-type H+-transporting ATPase subunit O